jgi:hypothetical protein
MKIVELQAQNVKRIKAVEIHTSDGEGCSVVIEDGMVKAPELMEAK